MSATTNGHVGYQYVVLRCVPRADREEFLNVGVILYSQARDVLRCAHRVEAARLSAFAPDLDQGAVLSTLTALDDVCQGAETAGLAASAPLGTRFGYLAAPRSTVVQPGPVHGGMTDDLDAELGRLLSRLVPSPEPGHRPTAASSGSAKTMDAAGWDDRYLGSDLVWGLEPNQFVRAQCQSLPVGVAVDLACGEGRNALWLATVGWQVLGIDFSPAAIERAEALAARQSEGVQSRLTWRVGDVTTMPTRPRSVDLALISYVHLDEGAREDLILSAAQMVRENGHLLLVAHDRRNLHEGVSGPQDEALLYDPAVVAAQLSRDGGLTIDLAATVERHTDAGIALDTLVRARRLPL